MHNVVVNSELNTLSFPLKRQKMHVCIITVVKSQTCSIRNSFLYYGSLQFKAYTKIYFYSGNYRDMVIASGNIALSCNIECL